MSILGERLEEAREYLGLSMEFVAEHLGTTAENVQFCEEGVYIPSADRIARFAALYKTTVEYLEGGIMDALPTPPLDNLTAGDAAEVLRFAQFLHYAGRAPKVDLEV